jgi:hypothetical protein
MNIFFVISKRVTKTWAFFGFYSFTHNWANLQKTWGLFFTRRKLHLISPPIYSLSNYINIHMNDCIHIQCICIYVSIVAHASNEYMYTYDFTQLYQLLHMHSMHMCIRIDCTHLYRLFCKCIQCICVYVWLHTFVSIVLHMHPMYMCIHLIAQVHINCCKCIQWICVYVWLHTFISIVLQMHPIHMCIHMIAHVWIDCCIHIIQCINVYVWLHTFELIVLHMHPMHMCIHTWLHMFVFIVTYSLPFLLWKKEEKASVLMYLL